ncbi:hypothetical protein BU24DRAFT_428902 [Aaosphaeria arxii CBS 175.79]|uniref:Uncharacterized protein n=1 Tax=Aaosphaeria arxii CBS 175.79 TaxID=1450172 RepID=A0A6A5X7L1_9PLEO|nr:uncharacterized protein BU24DRAFT_428902 [Aaosphaeria arxii CBS 175.79]KAF2008910.1 hypothetical protein BU24DRAFT_428902 [Aaosphaeria arxii CBS 175.79]
MIEMANVYRQYVPTGILPCAISATYMGAFHLLRCGHIVAVCDDNHQCARNCLHVVLTLGAGHEAFHKHIKQDELVCPSCFKISFSTLKANFHDTPLVKALRPTVSLTRSLLKRLVPALSDKDFLPNQYGGLLSAQYTNPNQDFLDYRQIHHLSCGHEVWALPMRPCAANCRKTNPMCKSHGFPQNATQADAIICSECMLKAEMIEDRNVGPLLTFDPLEGK